MPTGTSFPLRKVVLILGVAESLVALLFVVLMLQSSDPFAKAIGQGMAQLAMIPLLVCILPGLGLGLLNRWLPAALVLLLLAVPVAYIVWRMA
jgi:hypothetical protein